MPTNLLIGSVVRYKGNLPAYVGLIGTVVCVDWKGGHTVALECGTDLVNAHARSFDVLRTPPAYV
jgi:hypothetical protein